MRNIKYRLYLPKLNRMIYNKELDNLDVKYILKGFNLLKIDSNKEIIPMQYIGANDTFGKEIYEGDIIKRTDLTPTDKHYGKEEIGVVEYLNTQFVLKTKEGYYEISSDGPFYLNISDYDVIGNIYENPELVSNFEDLI